MNEYVLNIEKHTLENDNFRKVLITTNNQQLVVMSLNPKEDIGMEVHPDVDQYIKIESGSGFAILNGEEIPFEEGFSINIPMGTNHNIVNKSDSQPLKLYTIYSPPEHKHATIHRTKEDAVKSEEISNNLNSF